MHKLAHMYPNPSNPLFEGVPFSNKFGNELRVNLLI